jgi:hypothetical protein
MSSSAGTSMFYCMACVALSQAGNRPFSATSPPTLHYPPPPSPPTPPYHDCYGLYIERKKTSEIIISTLLSYPYTDARKVPVCSPRAP